MIHAERVTLDDAPAFGEPTDNTNARWPSYTSWADFCRELDIVDVMYAKGMTKGATGYFECGGKELYPLMPEHPGAGPITKGHLLYIEAAAARYIRLHPDHIAQYPPLKEGIEDTGYNLKSDYVDDPKYDGHLCRAEWLLYWLRWALENCEQPVFTNT